MESCTSSRLRPSAAPALRYESRLSFTQVLDKSIASLYMDSAAPEPRVGASAAADSRHAILPLWHA